jgi:membrane-associated protease RseP (regulator of RpoE activity)
MLLDPARPCSTPEDNVTEETPEAAPGAGEAAPPEAAPEPAETAETVATPAASVPEAPAPMAAGPTQPAGFFIPRWVGLIALAVVGVLIVGGIGYAIGHDNASGGGQNAGANFPGGGNLPGNGNFPGNGNLPGNGNFPGNGNQTLPGGGTFPGNGNGGSNGNGGTTQSGGFLGVAIQDPDDGSGAEITDVQSGSPADDAGLRAGDVITEVDGDQIADAAALPPAIRAHASGDTVTITYTRDGTTSTVDVTLGSAATRTQPS